MPEPETTEPSPRLSSILIVAFVSVVAGVLLSANLEKFDWAWPGGTGAATATSSSTGAPTAGGGEAAAAKPDAATRASAVDGENALDVSGAWTLTNRIESATNAAFKGLALGFQLKLQQQGNRITGAGTKMTENGESLPAGRRTPIAIEGTVDGKRLQLKFTERGAQRASTGQLSLELTDEGTLRGTFTSDAARARGTSVAQRSASQSARD